MKYYFIALFLFGTFLYGENLGIPKVVNPDFFYQKGYYALEYSEEYEQPLWVYYKLTKDEVNGSTPRKSYFKEDKDIKTGSASLNDYRSSGYDRGHLAPAADMKMSETSMRESFFMSNMSPQDPGFNRGIWRLLEEQIREWALENNQIFVVTGPIFTSTNVTTIGENKVGVPDFFFKVVLDYVEPEIKAIAFIIENKPSNMPLENYALTVREVEALTGLDFFFNIDVHDQESFETILELEKWFF